MSGSGGASTLADWRAKCFRQPPRRVYLERGTRLYRGWSQARSDKPGLLLDAEKAMFGSGFFEPGRPRGTMDAEMLGDVVRHGNLLRYLTTFEVVAGLYAWRGPIAQGDPLADHEMDDVDQVFVPNSGLGELRRHIRALETVSLLPTGWVVPESATSH